ASTERGRSSSEVPPMAVDWPAGAGLLDIQAKYATGQRHPLRTSLRLSSRMSKDQPFELRARHPRPVYPIKFFIPAELPRDQAREQAGSPAGALGMPGSGALTALCALAARGREAVDEKAVFLLSGSGTDCWNEIEPMPARGLPQFKLPKADDP